ncbi:MAG: TlpA disulfide reductase family protein [Acidimicrobiia bacterium]|jgi:thiol-disulfide isomerase/thioredoxin
MRLTAVFVIVIVVGLAVAWIVRSGEGEVAEVGGAAPDFAVELIEGGTFTLSEARGRLVVINLWASWCDPCREEIPAISAFADEHPEITVVGVAVNDPVEANTRRFAAEIGASYPLALGTDVVEHMYPFFGLPATYVVDEDGIVTEFVNGIVDEQILADLVSGS